LRFESGKRYVTTAAPVAVQSTEENSKHDIHQFETT
jgi:hypothetical protein